MFQVSDKVLVSPHAFQNKGMSKRMTHREVFGTIIIWTGFPVNRSHINVEWYHENHFSPCLMAFNLNDSHCLTIFPQFHIGESRKRSPFARLPRTCCGQSYSQPELKPVTSAGKRRTPYDAFEGDELRFCYMKLLKKYEKVSFPADHSRWVWNLEMSRFDSDTVIYCDTVCVINLADIASMGRW